MRGGCPDARQAAKRQTAVHSRVQTRRCRPGAYFRAGRSPRSPASLASTTPRSATGCAKTPSTVASVRAQHQLRDDLELVQRYGRDEAADHFGGCYWDNEPPVTIVALFTAEVDRHRTVLRSRVSQPARLAVRATPRTWRQVQADNEEIAAMLLTTRTESGVHGVGIGLREGRSWSAWTSSPTPPSAPPASPR
jgi:hypothetical protein